VKTGPTFRRFFLVSASFVLLATTLSPGVVAQSKEEVEQAEAERERALEEYISVQEEVDAAIENYEDIRSEIFEVEYRMDRLENRIGEDAEAAHELEQTARDLAVEAYVTGSLGTFSVALEAKNIQDVVTSKALFERANAISVASLDRLDAVSRELERLSTDLEDDVVHLGELEEEATLAIQRIEVVQRVALEWYEREDAEADAAKEAWRKELARRRAEEAARRAREAARKAREESGRAGVYGYLRCPQADPQWFRNDWGNPRSGGRTHKGTDMFAARGTKVYAVIGGTLRKRTGGLGGIAWWLYGDDGNAYYFAHLDGWKSGLETGSRVKKGAVIGYTGNTGNASGGATHTHFQLHPNGGAPVNPYPTLAEICR
jgi:murein DD-endopeptidase MepM/ murein hydrolase activator NlpD